MKKNLDFCWLVTSKSLNTEVNVPTVQEAISKKNLKQIFFVFTLKVIDENSRILIRNWIRIMVRKQVYGSKNPDPYHNVTDPEHWLRWLTLMYFFILFSLSLWFLPVFIELRFAFLSCFCRVSYVTISGSYLRHIGRLGGPHVAVVGAGPAGFYAAQHIAKENRRPSILISD